MALKRELGLFSTTMYGIGVIIGAGIYALIGVGAGMAGNMLWLAFLVSAAIALLTGFSYAELAGMFPKEGAEYHYTRRAFGREAPAMMVGWLLAIGVMIAASTVALGFGGYFSALFGVDRKLAAAGVIAAVGLLNWLGIRETAAFSAFSSSIEVLGLLIVIGAALLVPPLTDADLLQMPASGFGGIIAAASVVFFAYTGFESVANISEEVKDSRRNVPRALLLALGISTILYLLVSAAAVREVGWEALSQSGAPLALVVSRALGPYAAVLSAIALFATANTVLGFLVGSSRMAYGMSEGGSLPRALSATGSRGTPWLSVLLTTCGALAMALLLDIKTVAQLADLSIFLAYLAVNLSLIALAGSKVKRTFVSPRLLGVPVLAWLGVASILLMLPAFEPKLWLMELGLVATGLAVFLLGKRGGRVRPK